MKRNLSLQAAVTMAVFFTIIGSGGIAMIIFLLINQMRVTTIITRGTVFFVGVSLILSSIIGSVIFLLISRNLMKPIHTLSDALGQVARGDYAVRVDTGSGASDIRELETAFNDMTRELGSIELFRNDFINNFSHEFKTPILAVRGYAYQLKNDELTPQERAQYADVIIAESDRLAAMSRNVLLLTRFENQQIVTDKREFYLDEQLRGCILMLEKEWTAKDIELDLDLDEVVYRSNEDMLSHIWSNILSNAVKFTPAGGRIAVSCHADSAWVTVSVTDNGIGMDDATRLHVFDKFYQGDTSHRSSGNGLGMALAKRVTELAGGKITVKSRPDKGTTFTVKLPVTTPQS